MFQFSVFCTHTHTFTQPPSPPSHWNPNPPVVKAASLLNSVFVKSRLHLHWRRLSSSVFFSASPADEQAWWIIPPSPSQSWPSTRSSSRPTTISSSPRNMRWVRRAVWVGVKSVVRYWFPSDSILVAGRQQSVLLRFSVGGEIGAS